MGKITSINSLLFCLILAILSTYTTAESLKQEEPRLQNPYDKKPKQVKFHFYLQDVQEGPNATVWEVARSKITSNSPTDFGLARVMDDLITEKPDRRSKKLGRAQGLITYTGLEESALTMNVNFYLTDGWFKGSTLTVVGRNPISSKNRELPIAGGTGVFRMARGYTISNTYSYNTRTNYGVLEYTFFVVLSDLGDWRMSYS